MFTGLVEEIGTVFSISKKDRGTRLQVNAPAIASGVHEGDSVAVNGCCLTVTAHDADHLAFDLLDETLSRTNLRAARPGSAINLERALAANGRIGGHFVQGHIDCTARVLSFERSGSDYRLNVETPNECKHYLVYKGSIALNGISLTVAEVASESFAVWIIPHTRQHTNLNGIAVGDLLNVEFDLLAKYVERMLDQSASK